MKPEQSEDMVFDTGVLMELIAGTTIGRKAHRLLASGRTTALTTELGIAELRYIICRKTGWKRAKETVEKLLNTGYITTIPLAKLLDAASRMKCERALSFVDCFTIALGEQLGLTVVFARHERELDKELKKKPFSINIAFLEEMEDRQLK